MKQKLGPVSQFVNPPWLSKKVQSHDIDLVTAKPENNFFETKRHDDVNISGAKSLSRALEEPVKRELPQTRNALVSLAAPKAPPEEKEVPILSEDAKSTLESEPLLLAKTPEKTRVNPLIFDTLAPLIDNSEPLKAQASLDLMSPISPTNNSENANGIEGLDWSSVTELTMPSGDVMTANPAGAGAPRRSFDSTRRPGGYMGNKSQSRDNRYINPQDSIRAKQDLEDLFSGRGVEPPNATSGTSTPSPSSVARAAPVVTFVPKVERVISLPNESGSTTRVFQLSQGSKVLPEPKVTLSKPVSIPLGLREIPQEKLELHSLNSRLGLMSVKQRLAWLLLTPENDIRPMSHEQSSAMISTLLGQMSEDEFNEMMPSTYWIHDPVKQIPFYSDGRYRIKPLGEDVKDASVLPGGVGTWLSAHKLLASESVKRSVNAQRIKSISLAGLVIASNRFESFQWMLAERLNPLKAVAYLGCSEGAQTKGHDIGEINGYALALLSHSTQFFSWVQQWQSILEEQAQSRRHELTGALSLGIKTWSAAHGELSQSCAEMTATMLKLGAGISEWALLAFAPHGNNQVRTSAAWARFIAQTFSMDRNGQASKRIIDSARAMGYDIKSKPGEPQEMTAFAQADLDEAVAMFLASGFDPMVPDALGQTALDRARSARAQRVVALIEGYLRGDASFKSSEPTVSSSHLQEVVKVKSFESDDSIFKERKERKEREAREAEEASQKARDEAFQVLAKKEAELNELIKELNQTSRDIRSMDWLIGIAA